jgi:hypothetical protein
MIPTNNLTNSALAAVDIGNEKFLLSPSVKGGVRGILRIRSMVLKPRCIESNSVPPINQRTTGHACAILFEEY